MTVSAADYTLSSSSGIWTGTSGGNYITGLNTNEVRWGDPVDISKSGLRFDGTGVQAFNEGEPFLIGELTHFNWPIWSGGGVDGATLKVTLVFSSPTVNPNPEFTFDFDVLETTNEYDVDNCDDNIQQSSTPCDDRITFPSSYGEESYQIGDKLYTIKISGFVDSYPSGSPVSSFITEEGKDNTAYLVGTLSSILTGAPQITLVSKTVNGHVEETAPGLTLYIGDPITWEYLVQNTGNVALSSTGVSDPQVTVSCPKSSLQPGEAMTCTASGTAALGEHMNTAQAFGTYNSVSYYSEVKECYYTGIDLPVCGDGIKNQQSEECELANTENNDYCPQSTTGCQDNKLGVRDTLGVCNLNCLCAPDSFTDFQCVKDQCEAECDSSDDCDDGDVHTADGCLANCICGHETQPYCGDGIKNGAEQCDGTDGVGANQECNNDCQLIDLGFCGDGKLDTNEECDYNNGLVCTPACDSSCNYCDANCNTQTVNGDACPPTDVCGDGVMTGTEQCDAGNDNGIGCTPGGCGMTCNYCDSDCTTETNFGGICCNPATECCYAGAPGCGTPGVPEFPLFTLGLAIVGVGLGLALLRKK